MPLFTDTKGKVLRGWDHILDLIKRVELGRQKFSSTLQVRASVLKEKSSLVGEKVELLEDMPSIAMISKANYIVAGVDVYEVIKSMPEFVPSESMEGFNIGVLGDGVKVYKDSSMHPKQYILGHKGKGVHDPIFIYVEDRGV